MTKKILIQLDIDSHASSFDAVVATDAGVEQLLQYTDVQADNVTPIVHGAMFTRGGDDLKHTAIFIGGSNVATAENVLKACQDAFFGPVRVSLMLDANGCNTTASAAVVAAARHVKLDGARAVVLGGTGPVGRRAAQLLASDGANVILTSRSLDRASAAADEVSATNANLSGTVSGGQAGSPAETADVVRDAAIVIACGAAGVELIDEATIKNVSTLKVAIDLNAVPPAGIAGIGVTDKAKSFGAGVAYGAIGVGGLKMKTHRAAIESLFTSNDKVLDAAEIYAIAKSIG
jgi:methylenetetrahydrofolate/methylenetetrahydromethanopterin dehydrogenase (NADP+)